MLHCLYWAPASEQVLPASTQTVTQAARVKSTVVSVWAGSPWFLPPQCHHLPYQKELPILMGESSSYSCWVNFLFKGSFLYVQHQGYLTSHLWLFCWPVPEFKWSSLCQCLLFLRLKKTPILLLLKCKLRKTRSHVWFIFYFYTISSVHSSLLICVERINEWMMSKCWKNEWMAPLWEHSRLSNLWVCSSTNPSSH